MVEQDFCRRKLLRTIKRVCVIVYFIHMLWFCFNKVYIQISRSHGRSLCSSKQKHHKITGLPDFGGIVLMQNKWKRNNKPSGRAAVHVHIQILVDPPSFV